MKEVEKLQPRAFTKFCMSIGAVPSSYIAGLTIEEQILWFCSYLEKNVIPAINNNAEAVTEVQNLMIQLQDYVDNYFENLDVQEEINKKLDKMVEDGTLENIISSYLGENITIAFPTYNSNGVEITGQDVQGDCTIIKSTTKNIVIDTMKTTDNFSSIQSTMSELDIDKIDYFIITHYHYDHYNNFENFINNYDVSNCLFIIPRLPNYLAMKTEAETGYNYIMNILTSNDLDYVVCDNQTFTFDGATMKLMNGSQADYDYIDSTSPVDYNNYSLCVEFTYKDKKVLITGDIANVGQHNVVPTMVGNYDLMKDCHHGLSEYDEQFAKLCNPKNLVVPVTKAMWSYNQAKFGGPLLSYFLTETPNIYLLGYQNEAIIYKIGNNGVNLISSNFTDNNLKLAIKGTTTFYVNSSTTQLKRDGSSTYPFASLKECLSLINKNTDRNYIVEVQANETITERYIVYGLKSTIINFNNYTSGPITFENCSNCTLNNANITNSNSNDSVGDLYIKSCDNIKISENAVFSSTSKSGIEIVNSYNIDFANTVLSLSNKTSALVVGNSKVILETTSVSFTSVSSCIWCYNSEFEGTATEGAKWRTALSSSLPVISGNNQKRNIISKGFKNAINVIFSGDKTTDAISFPYAVLEYDSIEVHYEDNNGTMGLIDIPIKNAARSHAIDITYPNDNGTKIYVVSAQLYCGAAGTYATISRNTNITLPDGTVGNNVIHITKLILK